MNISKGLVANRRHSPVSAPPKRCSGGSWQYGSLRISPNDMTCAGPKVQSPKGRRHGPSVKDNWYQVKPMMVPTRMPARALSNRERSSWMCSTIDMTPSGSRFLRLRSRGR